MKSIYIIGIVLLLCSSCTGSQESYSRYADFLEMKNLIQSNELFQQIAQSIQQEKFLPEGGRYLYVFTLTGAPLLCYQLDHYVSGIHVDEQSSAMIAVDANRDRPVVEFHLGE